MKTRKRLILKIGGVLFAVVLLLTFFSSTLYLRNAPAVLVGFEQSRVITTNMRAEAVVEPNHGYIVYAPRSGIINFHVSESDVVRPARLLFDIRPDEETILRRIENYYTQLERLEISRSMTQADLLFAQSRLAVAASRLERNSIEHQIDILSYTLMFSDIDERDINESIAQLYESLVIKRQSFEDVFVHYPAETTVMVQSLFGLESGMHVERNQPIMRVSPLTENRVTAYFPERLWRQYYEFVSVKDFEEEIINNSILSIRIDVPGVYQFGIEGEIEHIASYRGRTRLDLVFPGMDSIYGGERAIVVVEFISDLYGRTLPNSAIRHDQGGSFILFAQREGFGFSAAYYARRMNIVVQEEGDWYTAFTRADVDIGAVIIQSDRPVHQNERIRLAAER